MASVVNSGWFGRGISVLLVNGKTMTGELTEISDHYIVIESGGASTQIMVHAIIAVRLAEEKEEQPE